MAVLPCLKANKVVFLICTSTSVVLVILDSLRGDITLVLISSLLEDSLIPPIEGGVVSQNIVHLINATFGVVGRVIQRLVLDYLVFYVGLIERHVVVGKTVISTRSTAQLWTCL